jgi:hypothetical protein
MFTALLAAYPFEEILSIATRHIHILISFKFIPTPFLDRIKIKAIDATAKSDHRK